MQFLFESSAICLLGGAIGIAIAALVTLVINATLMPAKPSVPIV
jgi:ABC-type antimicrobial peptide transport system permease subunit